MTEELVGKIFLFYFLNSEVNGFPVFSSVGGCHCEGSVYTVFNYSVLKKLK